MDNKIVLEILQCHAYVSGNLDSRSIRNDNKNDVYYSIFSVPIFIC